MDFVCRVAMARGPHPIPSRTRSLSLFAPMVLCLEARERRSPPGIQNPCFVKRKSCTPLHLFLPGCISCARGGLSVPGLPAGTRSIIYLAEDTGGSHIDAGWSSSVARQAHNLKVAGSNPAPATKTITRAILAGEPPAFLVSFGQWQVLFPPSPFDFLVIDASTSGTEQGGDLAITGAAISFGTLDRCQR